MRSHPKISLLVAVMAVLLVTGTVAFALTERLSNGSFATDIAGWANLGTGGAIAWQSDTGHTANGAAKITNSSGANTSVGGVQCVDIPLSDGTKYYTAKGWIYVPAGQPANFSYAYLRVRYYPQDGCAGTALGTNLDSNQISTTDSWQEVTKVALAPNTAESAQYRLYIRTSGAGDNPFAYFDDMTFYDSNANAVTLRTLSAAAPAASAVPWAVLPVVGLLVGGAALYRRRARAA